MKKNGLLSIFWDSAFVRNSIFVMVLGMCPTLATSTSAFNALGMGVSVTFVPCFIVLIACFSTIVQLLLKAYIPALDAALGIFIPLIVVNCIILERAESFASKNKVLPSIFDALGTGVGFTAALTIIGIIRELLGSGSVFGFSVLPQDTPTMLGFIMAPGGFITLGAVLGAAAAIGNRRKRT